MAVNVLIYELKKIGKVVTSTFFATGPSSYKKRIYRAAVSQRLRNTGLNLAARFSLPPHKNLSFFGHSTELSIILQVQLLKIFMHFAAEKHNKIYNFVSCRHVSVS